MSTTRNRRKKKLKTSKEAFLCEGATIELHAKAGEDTPRVEAVAYSGGKLYVSGFDLPVVVDLSGVEVNANANFLLDHKSNQRVGHPESIDVGEREIRVRGKLSAASPHRDEVIASHRDGMTWQMSIGARIISAKRVEANQSEYVNGREIEGPFILATKSRLNEISFVGNGGDEDTSVRIAAERQQAEKKQPPKPKNENESKSEELTMSASQAAPKAETTETVDVVAQMRERAAAEAERLALLDEKLEGFPKLKAEAIRSEWSEDKIELELLKAKNEKLEAMRESRSTGPAVHSRSADDLVDSEIYAASLHRQFSGHKADDFIAAEYGEEVAEKSRRLPKALGPKAMLRATIEAAGDYAPAGMSANELFQQAIIAERKLRNGNLEAASGFSTFSLSGTLSNLANKRLLEVYREWPSLVPRICGMASHSDFKTWSKYRVSGDLDLELLPPTGEIKHGTVDEDTYTNKLLTYAKMLAVTRVDFINDDLGAFSRLGRHFGLAAMRTREKVFWTAVCNPGSSFFHANNSNLQTGHGTISIAAVKAAEDAMANQTSKEGNPIMIQPDLVVCPVARRSEAKNLFDKRTIHVAGDPAATTQTRVFDEYSGEYAYEVTPWLNTANSIPGAIDTTWYLFGTKDVPAFEYASMAGEEGPQLDSTDTDFNTLGFQTRTYWDFGFAEQDPRGAQKVTA